MSCDLVPLEVFSREAFEEKIDKDEKKEKTPLNKYMYWTIT
ncbi:hypothetical protein J2S21_004225 [Peribacillus cavernae]|nr:hypothetical protein [Peribacillus cavernae]